MQPLSEGDLSTHTRLSETITLFQRHLQRQGKTAHTVNAFTSDLHLLAEFLGEDKFIGGIVTRDLNDFLHWLEFERGVPCSRKSYARRVTTLKVYFKWLHGLEVIPYNPANTIVQRSGPAPLQAVLTDEDIAAALAFCAERRAAKRPDARPELLFRLLLTTGIKKGETMRLEPRDIEGRASPMLRVRQSSARNVYKERLIPLEPDWPALLDEYLAQYTPKKTIFECTPRNLEYVLEDIGEGAGLDKKISFEMMRWTCGVHDYLSGMDPNAIREKLGLSRISWYETFSKIKQLAGEGSAAFVSDDDQ